MFNDIQHSLSENNEESFSNESRLILVFNKVDMVESEDAKILNIQLWEMLTDSKVSNPKFISCKNGHGLDSLESDIHENINSVLQPPSKEGECKLDTVLITRERHRRHVQKCVNHLEMFLYNSVPMDLAAEEIRLAMLELGRVTGRVDVDEILDIIFRDFCIGK